MRGEHNSSGTRLLHWRALPSGHPPETTSHQEACLGLMQIPCPDHSRYYYPSQFYLLYSVSIFTAEVFWYSSITRKWLVKSIILKHTLTNKTQGLPVQQTSTSQSSCSHRNSFCCILYIYLKKNVSGGWKTGSAIKKALLFLQRTQVQFLAPNCGSQLFIVNSSPTGSNTFLWLLWALTFMWGRYIYARKTLIHIKLFWEVGMGVYSRLGFCVVQAGLNLKWSTHLWI